MEEKKHCWEFMECGREPGGSNVDEFGICPASTTLRYDKINGGNFAGRFCWFVSGTLCNGFIQGTFATKIKNCINCPFFLDVARQEGKSIVFIKY